MLGAIVAKIGYRGVRPWWWHHCLIFFDISYALTLSMAETPHYDLRHDHLIMGLVSSWAGLIGIFVLNLRSVAYRDIARIPELREAILADIFAYGIRSAVRDTPVDAHVDPIMLRPPIYPHPRCSTLSRIKIILQIVGTRARPSL